MSNDYSYGEGSYTLISDPDAGVVNGIGVPADWNTISYFKSALKDAVDSGGFISAAMLEPRAIPIATFAQNGIAKVESNIPSPTFNPRNFPINFGRGYAIMKLVALQVPSSHLTTTFQGLALGNLGSTIPAYYEDGVGSGGTSTSTGALNATFGVAATGAGTQHIVLGGRPYFYSKIRTTSDIADMRFWLIFQGNGGVLTADDPGAGNDYIGVRYSSGVNGGKFELVSNDGAGSTSTDMGVAVLASTLYECEMWYDGTSLLASINGGTPVSKTTDLPAYSTGIGATMWIGGGAAKAAAVKSITVFGAAKSCS